MALTSLSLFAKEKQEDKSFRYGGIGATVNVLCPIPVPHITVGYRDRQNDSAFDTRASFSSIGICSAIDVNLQMLDYKESNSYIGGGIGGGFSFCKGFNVLSAYPIITFGKEKEKAFQEVSFTAVAFSTIGFIASPCVNYTYGFKF